MNNEDRPKQKCTFKGCVNQGSPRDGYDFFACDHCLEEAATLIDAQIRKHLEVRVKQLFARHMNN